MVTRSALASPTLLTPLALVLTLGVHTALSSTARDDGGREVAVVLDTKALEQTGQAADFVFEGVVEDIR